MLDSILILKIKRKEKVLYIKHSPINKSKIDCFEISNWDMGENFIDCKEAFLVNGKKVWKIQNLSVSHTFSEIGFEKAFIIN